MRRFSSVSQILPAAAALCLLGHAAIQSRYQPMWLDEVYTYYGVAHGSFAAFMRSFSTGVNATPPLYFAVVWALSRVVPLSVLSLRLYSSLGCCAAFWLVWATLRRHTSFLVSSAAALAALFTSELFLTHNAEARFYGAYLACAAWAVYNCDRLWTDPKPPARRLVWNALSHALAISCNYVAGLYSAAILLSLMVRDRNARVWRPAVYLSIVAGWAPALLYVPLVMRQKESSWLTPPGVYAALEPVDLGLHSYLLFAVFAGIAAIAYLRKSRPVPDEREYPALMGFAILAVPYALLALNWVGLPILLGRYALPSLIGAALLFAWICKRLFGEPGGQASGWSRFMGRLLSAAMVAGLLAFPLWRALSSARTAVADNKVARYLADERGLTVATSDPHT